MFLMKEILDLGGISYPLSHGEGFVRHRVWGSYVHLHGDLNPDVAGQFVGYCRRDGNAP